jgi:hypothetical protein
VAAEAEAAEAELELRALKSQLPSVTAMGLARVRVRAMA